MPREGVVSDLHQDVTVYTASSSGARLSRPLADPSPVAGHVTALWTQDAGTRGLTYGPHARWSPLRVTAPLCPLRAVFKAFEGAAFRRIAIAAPLRHDVKSEGEMGSDAVSPSLMIHHEGRWMPIHLLVAEHNHVCGRDRCEDWMVFEAAISMGIDVDAVAFALGGLDGR